MKANSEKGTDAEVTDAIASARDVKSFMVVLMNVENVCWKLQGCNYDTCDLVSYFEFLIGG